MAAMPREAPAASAAIPGAPAAAASRAWHAPTNPATFVGAAHGRDAAGGSGGIGGDSGRVRPRRHRARSTLLQQTFAAARESMP